MGRDCASVPTTWSYHIVNRATVDKCLVAVGDYTEGARTPMPINMDPSKKRRRAQSPAQAAAGPQPDTTAAPRTPFGEETSADREKDMADAEWKNLWDATEVIDMDKV